MHLIEIRGFKSGWQNRFKSFSHVRWAEMMRILLWFSCFAAFAGSIRGDPDFGECSNVITQWLKEPWGPTEEGHILIKAGPLSLNAFLEYQNK